ncbi:MAG: cytochrome c [Sphingomonas sp.]|nr:cytochrome c [Sphingomonas sp.]
MPRKKLLHILLGAVIAIVFIVPLGVYSFVKSGIYNVAAAHPHTKFTEWITHETMIHAVRRHSAGIPLPGYIAGAQVLRGFCTYETHCVACHGAAAVAREQWAAGMEPTPPYLLDTTSKWTPQQLFWIAKNGIKMTGMPSWRGSLSDGQIWDVVGFLEAMRDLPPQTYVQWRSRRMCGGFKGPWPAPGPASTPPAEPVRPTAATGGSAPSSKAAARP